MAIIKCKMCGGDLDLKEGQSVAECEYCGSVQTVPTADNEKKLTLFARANRLRAACDFDKAAGVYESIVAEFPEEAEAYWGLVLCKYGIEYVDDPATGKKIPTCHRSSYDSVMDDGNFEQATENADVVAQKVYREEAKQFERIRKGILEVSSSEKPYDIFICYKETAENGDRTLDSVLAQDLYSALTDKGYRVFFSRITLQGKLGEAYEPYIFAALNSAKVMLAVGTCYEYYNAVWVKNEWSRYLKICEADKSKHLIPCFKDLDPEDMPKEFNHLQGADLGKMGAVQDILFNMEKYIPLKKQTVVQERVVVSGGDNKIASLLDRGNMALEDEDWAKADSFFEDVLNNDSKNAQAYLGKTLAQEKCRTIDAFARKRKDITQDVRGTYTLHLEKNNSHVSAMVAKYSIPGYVEKSDIYKLYEFDLSYRSDVAERTKQYQTEETYWNNHKQLSRAEQFATGAVAENLAKEKAALFAVLSERVKQAQTAEAAAKENLQKRYEAHLKRADEKAEELYQGGENRRAADYQALLQTAKTSSDVYKLIEAAGRFELLGDYKDSKKLAEHCHKRADEEKTKLDEEAERRRILAEEEAERQRLIKEKETAARAKKNRKLGIMAGSVAVIAIAVVLMLTQLVIPNTKYNDAIALLDAGNYEEAIESFESLNGYKDSVSAADYAAANIFIQRAETNDDTYIELLERFEDEWAVSNQGSSTNISVSPDSTARDDSVEIERVSIKKSSENRRMERYFTAAEAILMDLGDYRDSAQLLDSIATKRETAYEQQYSNGEAYLQNGDYERAAETFAAIGQYRDVEEKLDYIYAQQLLENGYYDEAKTEFIALGDYSDSTEMAKEAEYCRLVALHELCEKYNLSDVYFYWDQDLISFAMDVEKYREIAPDDEVTYASSVTLRVHSAYSCKYNVYTPAEGAIVKDFAETFDVSCELMLYDVNKESDINYLIEFGDIQGEPMKQYLEKGFAALGNYKNADAYMAEKTAEHNDKLYVEANTLMATGDYSGAASLFTELGNYLDSASKLKEAKNAIVRHAEEGDTVKFGHYEQDGNTANGAEEIEWIVMEKSEGQMVLFSKYILETMAFDTNKSNSWNNSTLKAWLNSTFMESAFSDEEQAKIQTTSAGSVYLFSEEELEKYYGDLSSYSVYSKLVAKLTQQASFNYGGQSWWWWTRTSDGYHNAANCVKYVSEGGRIGGNDVTFTGGGVRPAITISIGE